MKKVISFEKELDFPTMIGEITSISLDQNVEFLDPNSAAGELVVSGGYKLTEASTLIEDFKYDIPVEITLTEKLELSTTKISIIDFNYEIINDDILKCNIDLLLEGVEEVEIEETEEDEEIPEEEKIEEIESIKEENKEIFAEVRKEGTRLDETKLEEGKSEEVRQKEARKEEKIVEKIEVLKEKEDRECDGDFDNETIEKEIPVKMDNIKKDINEIEMPQAEIILPKQKEEIMENTEQTETTNISSLFQVFENSVETFTTYSVYIMRKEDTLDKIMDTYHVNREQLSEYNDLNSLEIGSKVIIPSCSNE